MGKKDIHQLDLDQLARLFSVATDGGSGPDAGDHKPESAGQGDASAQPEELLSTQSPNAPVEHVGSWVGPYRLVGVLGEGGMGIVYLADQTTPMRRRVALKVIKPGMDSQRVIARFDAERQALALLDHPNIAQVYDAGTTDGGRPYFVMEHVKGLPITEYCDRHKLTIDERLRLFQQVCFAVHHAHQKGIIHRDIKPSNIMVSGENDRSIPKIIDFGVAKAISQPLTEQTLLTEDSQLLGTPEYMSPEQAEMVNEDIDTRSDIYSLGVLLYVLLAGILPYDAETFRQGGIEHIRKTIRETDPKTPSTRLIKLGEDAKKFAESRRSEVAALAKCLHRELEWIPLKAMRKERAERYRSASELADDIENYLKGAPLIAGPPGAGYRLKKFVRRNRVLVGGIAAVLLVLVAGVVVSTIFAIGQARARTDAQLVTNFLRMDVLRSAYEFKGREATVIDVLNAAVDKLDSGKLQRRPLIEASIRATLATIYWGLGDYRASALQREHAYRIYLGQLGEEHGTTRGVMNWLAVSYNFTGQYREAEMLWDELIEKRPTGQQIAPWLKCNLAVAYANQGRYEDSERLLLEMLEPAYWDPNHANHGRALLYSWDLARVYREQGRYKEAEDLFVKALTGQRQRFGLKGDETNMMMIRCMNELARLYVILDRDGEAVDLFTEGMAMGDRTLPGKDHPFTLRHVNGLALIRIKQQRYEEAKTLLDRALAGRKLKLGDDHPETLETLHDLGILHREQGHYEEAERLLTEALNARRVRLGADHPHTLASVHELAVLYMRQARYNNAEPLLLDAFRARETKLGPEHPHTIDSLKQLVNLYEFWNRPDEAARWRAKLVPTKAAED
jgi:non-specific serine/threonine protein kinase/serine/threonine-protein kinase